MRAGFCLGLLVLTCVVGFAPVPLPRPTRDEAVRLVGYWRVDTYTRNGSDVNSAGRTLRIRIEGKKFTFLSRQMGGPETVASTYDLHLAPPEPTSPRGFGWGSNGAASDKLSWTGCLRFVERDRVRMVFKSAQTIAAGARDIDSPKTEDYLMVLVRDVESPR